MGNIRFCRMAAKLPASQKPLHVRDRGAAAQADFVSGKTPEQWDSCMQRFLRRVLSRAARPQTAFWFLQSLRLHLFCVPHATASCLCPFLLFTKRRKPQRGKEGKGLSCLKVFCAFPDAQPLIPAVPETWQSLWLFDVVERDVLEDFQPFPRSAAHYEPGSDTAKLHKLPE